VIESPKSLPKRDLLGQLEHEMLEKELRGKQRQVLTKGSDLEASNFFV